MPVLISKGIKKTQHLYGGVWIHIWLPITCLFSLSWHEFQNLLIEIPNAGWCEDFLVAMSSRAMMRLRPPVVASKHAVGFQSNFCRWSTRAASSSSSSMQSSHATGDQSPQNCNQSDQVWKSLKCYFGCIELGHRDLYSICVFAWLLLHAKVSGLWMDTFSSAPTSFVGCKYMKWVQDDCQFQVVSVAIYLVIFGACKNILFIIKAKLLKLINKWSYRFPQLWSLFYRA